MKELSDKEFIQWTRERLITEAEEFQIEEEIVAYYKGELETPEDNTEGFSEIGKNIRKFRKAKGWTVEELAQKMNMPVQAIDIFENGKIRYLLVGDIYLFADVLGSELHKLFEK